VTIYWGITGRRRWRRRWVPRSRTWPQRWEWSSWKGPGRRSQRSAGLDTKHSNSPYKTPGLPRTRGGIFVMSAHCNIRGQGVFLFQGGHICNLFISVLCKAARPIFRTGCWASRSPQPRRRWPAGTACPAPHNTPRWSTGRWWWRRAWRWRWPAASSCNL